MMTNTFKYDLEHYTDSEEAAEILSRYLNLGSLSLCLGAGVSYSHSLPNWSELVFRCFIRCESNKLSLSKDLKIRVDNDIVNRFENLSNDDLKKIIDSIKSYLDSDEKYFQTVKKSLYERVNFDFSLAKKDTLIALSSLMLGKTRGTVKNILTYNFDSVLEWYMMINGLRCNILSPNKIIINNADVNITHIHGFLPSEEVSHIYQDSDFLVFSRKEFEDRNLDPYDLWKEIMNDFFRKNIFLTFGLGEDSLVEDICPHLRVLLKNKYETKYLNRDEPFGYAILSDSKQDHKDELIETGIVPIYMKIKEMPNFLFSIVQKASKEANIS